MKTEERHFDYLCECDGRACHERISLNSLEAKKIFNQDGVWAIADSCLHGPESNYVLVEEGDGYKIYRAL